MYKIKELSFSYKLGSQTVPVLNNISMEILPGKLVCLSGPSGSGKSTLLNLLGLIEPMQEGSIILNDEEIATMGGKRKNSLRRYEIGFIFQQFHLFPVLTVEENVAYFLKRQKLPKAEIETRCRWSLERVGLWDHRRKLPGKLSGGQRQRVAIARALAKKPRLIIADELTASLDQKTGKEIIELLAALVKEEELSVIIATHDPMVLDYANQRFHLRDGELIKEVSP